MKYFGIDIGGTNLRLAQINPKNGELISKIHKFEFKDIESNKKLSQIIFSILPKDDNFVVGVSIAAKIDLDSQKILKCMLNPIYAKEGKFGFIKELKKRKIKTFILNDVLSSSLGYLYFKKNNIKNYVVLTSSTGFNACPIFRGKFFTTPELGMIDFNSYFGFETELAIKMLQNYGIDYLPIGNFLSGNAYKHYSLEYFKKYGIKKNNELIKLTIADLISRNIEVNQKNILNNIHPKNVVKAYTLNNTQSPQKELVQGTWQSLETILFILVSAYSPLDEIVFMGSMTKDWDVLFKQPIDKFIKRINKLFIKKPIIHRSKIKELGIRGAVYFAHNHSNLF